MKIVPITPENALVFKIVRLRALRESPSAFGSTWAKESQFTDEEWIGRVVHWGSTRAGFLAMEDDTPRGMIAIFPEEGDPARAHVVSMWVAPESRRSGVGRRLVDTVKNWAMTRGFGELALDVTSSNGGAIEFYLRNGFSMTGRTQPYPNDAAFIEYEMTFPLGKP